jgi:hypothetical protein
MPTRYHNITGVLTQELVAPGDKIVPKEISIANLHATNAVVVDLYIEKKLEGSYYIIKGVSIATGANLILNQAAIKISTGWGMYIKLGAATSVVDVIIS